MELHHLQNRNPKMNQYAGKGTVVPDKIWEIYIIFKEFNTNRTTQKLTNVRLPVAGQMLLKFSLGLAVNLLLGKGETTKKMSLY